MKMPLTRLFLFLLPLTFFTTPAHAADSNLKATIDGTNAYRPTLQLTNASNSLCQIAKATIGTIAITEVQQHGKAITPLAIEPSFSDGLETELASSLTTLKPGDAVTLPLDVFAYQHGKALQSIAWSQDAGAAGMLYPLVDNSPLGISLTYSVPIVPNQGAPLCGPAAASNIQNVSGIPWKLITELAAGTVIFAVLLIILWRMRKKPTAVAIILTLLGGGALFSGHPAHARTNVASDIAARYNACMAQITANRDVTGPVLNAINRPDVQIDIVGIPVGTPGGSNTIGIPNPLYFRISWIADTRGYTRYDDPGGCTALYHEMYHIFDMLQGTFSRDICLNSGIETKEVMATRAQNLLRSRIGLLPRDNYAGHPLPTGDCFAPPPRSACDGGRCADSNGDPHLTTFDGLHYDFQAVGEFIAARDKSGFEIQVRQEPWPGSRFVAINTAVAMRVGSDRVEVRISGQNLVLLVNGKAQTLQDTMLAGGAIKNPSPREIVVSWADGTYAHITPVGTYGLHLMIEPAPSKASKLEGLLGNFDDDYKNDLKMQGSGKAVQPDFNQLYPAFADSWRIDSNSSLFTYDPGKSTNSYTDHTFPDRRVTINELPNRAAAEAICRSFGVVNPTILENCILDVALTGRPEFAKAASSSQLIFAGSVHPDETWPISVKNPGDKSEVTFNGKAGDKIFVDATNSTIPDQCGVLLLFDPSHNEIASGCIVNGRGYIDGTVLPSTGTYTISVVPSNTTGSLRLALSFIQDKQMNITADGPDAITSIDRPGEVSRLKFNGQAGQRAFVWAKSTTIPDQCGAFKLLDPGNNEIAIGCLVSGKGFIDTTILPVNGTYTILIDPAAYDTGQIKVDLIAAHEQTGALTINDPEVVANIDKPGSTSVLGFDDQAGQQVYLELTNSTIDDQCGVAILRAPDGSIVRSSCIINGHGESNQDVITLPMNGHYTLTIDPAGWGTGQATVRLHI